jgi:outer membrane beta-barrel protein
MKRASIALLAGFATVGLTQTTFVGSIAAQDMTFSADEVDTQAPDGGTPPAEGDTPPAEGTEGDSLLGDLRQQGTQADQAEAAPRRTEASEEIYAIQQIYALRNGRVEVAPSWSFTINDQYVSHQAPGIGLNYWFTNVLAVGLNFLWYEGLENESDLNFNVRRSTRLAVPITQYQLGAHLNFTYVPLYGKFAMFNEYIFQWDAYLVGGVGMLRTRPVPVVDPEIRQFEYGMRVAFNVGIGIRVFLSRWLAVFAELRDYMYLEKLEALNVALDVPGEPSRRQDPNTWIADSPSFTNNVTAHLGFTLFFPPSFEYKLPR